MLKAKRVARTIASDHQGTINAVRPDDSIVHNDKLVWILRSRVVAQVRPKRLPTTLPPSVTPKGVTTTEKQGIGNPAVQARMEQPRHAGRVDLACRKMLVFNRTTDSSKGVLLGHNKVIYLLGKSARSVYTLGLPSRNPQLNGLLFERTSHVMRFR
tara:strand:- start:38 stop:505 length:468 start_codon:yes stop_codon:yes gene_type:complete